MPSLPPNSQRPPSPMPRSSHDAYAPQRSVAFQPAESRPATSFEDIPQLPETSRVLGLILDKASVALFLSERGSRDQPAWLKDIEAAESVRMTLRISDACGNVLSLYLGGQIAASDAPLALQIPPAAAMPQPSKTARRQRAALPKWRLKCTIDYIETHLDETVTLADLARAVGLTSMHFAAQFRAATGIRPHEYLLRRRIERAQDLLQAPSAKLVDVALSVGFQTQAHFTTVFKRFTGTTPHQWRRENCQTVRHPHQRGDQWIHAEPSEMRQRHDFA
jgi:AraC-like DNA-binding protein